MAEFLLVLVSAVVVGAIGFGVFAFTIGKDRGLSDIAPNPLAERLGDLSRLTTDDVDNVRFDVVVRGYRMDQVDAFLAKSAADLRYWQSYARALEDNKSERTFEQPAEKVSLEKKEPAEKS